VQKWWSILFGVVLALSFGSFILAYCYPGGGWWMPKDISTFGYKVDFLFYVILAITGFFFVLTEAILVYNMYRYIAHAGKKSDYTHGNHKLEVFWTSVTAVVLVFIAVAQIRAWEDIKYQTRMPPPDQVFEVSARQFEWRLRHPSSTKLTEISTEWKEKKREPAAAHFWERSPEADDVYVVNEVHTWKGAKVRLYLKTRDVIHSFFLPNLRLKQDALPGKTIPIWFETKDSNVEWDEAKGAWKISEKWELACAELCGWGHSKMQGRLFVHKDQQKDQQEYERWLQQIVAKQDAHAPADDMDKPNP
jgi:cytochrome c oxidase subunit 2